MGYSADESLILEIKGGRDQVVHTSPGKDMGDGETLTEFLRFGKEHYPADRYALILWDHGGGVLEGVCWDEQYVQSFGTLLTEKELIRWKDLVTRSEGLNEKGEHSFSLQLTEEEAEHLSSAQLLIVKESGHSSHLDDGVAVVGAVRAELGGDHTVRADYGEQALYVAAENGEMMGPLSYLQTTDGAYNVVRTNFIRRDRYDFEDGKRILFYLDAQDRSENPEIVFTRTWDEETQSYSSRFPFDKDLYRMLTFWDENRNYPEAEEGVLPDYYDWEKWDRISAYTLSLPNEWHFTIRSEQLTGTQLYAMFRLTDVQQNVYCSVPVPIENKNREYLHFSQARNAASGCDFAMRGYPGQYRKGDCDQDREGYHRQTV